jgi:hypothetical protein
MARNDRQGFADSCSGLASVDWKYLSDHIVEIEAGPPVDGGSFGFD